MRRRVLAFDLDGTLAASKSPISESIATLLGDTLALFDVCVISGGRFEQFEEQLINRLHVEPRRLARLHLMPTSGARYFRFLEAEAAWVQQYGEDLTPEQKNRIIAVLTEGSKHLGYWEASPHGEIIEDRGSQITYSALGQKAPPELKYAWDRDGKKKDALRRYVAERLLDLEVRAGGTTSIDVTCKGIDKAYGMRRLITLLAVAPADILFFGDQLEEGGNDHPVKSVEIDTIAVRDPQDTALALEAILAVSA